MSGKIAPIDLYARISEPAGWVDDRPPLSEAEISELAGLIEPALSENEREQFGVYVQRIFARAVDGLLTKQKYDDQPVVAMRGGLEKFLEEMERAQAAIDGLDEGVGRLLDDELLKLARAQDAPRELPKTSIEPWRAAVFDLIGVVVSAGRRLEVKPVRGESETVWRQMVRGLADLVQHLTGETPKREVKAALVGISATQVDDGWFLQLSRRLAALAFARAQKMQKALAPRSKAAHAPPKKTVIRGRRSPTKKKMRSLKKNSRAVRGSHESQDSRPSKKEPKRVGPPRLTGIVRQELAGLEQKITE